MIVKILAVICLSLFVYYQITEGINKSENYKKNHPDSKEGDSSEEHY